MYIEFSFSNCSTSRIDIYPYLCLMSPLTLKPHKCNNDIKIIAERSSGTTTNLTDSYRFYIDEKEKEIINFYNIYDVASIKIVFIV